MWEKIFFKEHDFKPWENNSPNNSIYDHFPSGTPANKNTNRNPLLHSDVSSSRENEELNEYKGKKKINPKMATGNKNINKDLTPDIDSSSSLSQSDESLNSGNKSSGRTGSAAKKRVPRYPTYKKTFSSRSKSASGSRSPPQKAMPIAREQPKASNIFVPAKPEIHNTNHINKVVQKEKLAKNLSPELPKAKNDIQNVPKKTQAQPPPVRPQSSQAKVFTKRGSESKEPEQNNNNNFEVTPYIIGKATNPRPQTSPRKFTATSPSNKQVRLYESAKEDESRMNNINKLNSKYVTTSNDVEGVAFEERKTALINKARRDSSLNESINRKDGITQFMYNQTAVEEKPININRVVQDWSSAPRVVLVDKNKKFVTTNQIMNAQVKIKNLTFKDFIFKMENNQNQNSNLSNSALSFTGYKKSKLKFLNKSGAVAFGGSVSPEFRPISANTALRNSPAGTSDNNTRRVESIQPLIKNFMRMNKTNESFNNKHKRRSSKSANNITLKIVQYPMISHFNKL